MIKPESYGDIANEHKDEHLGPEDQLVLGLSSKQDDSNVNTQKQNEMGKDDMSPQEEAETIDPESQKQKGNVSVPHEEEAESSHNNSK